MGQVVSSWGQGLLLPAPEDPQPQDTAHPGLGQSSPPWGPNLEGWVQPDTTERLCGEHTPAPSLGFPSQRPLPPCAAGTPKPTLFGTPKLSPQSPAPNILSLHLGVATDPHHQPAQPAGPCSKLWVGPLFWETFKLTL